jgi:hypothetical protein
MQPASSSAHQGKSSTQPVACLEPRQPSTPPSGSWVPDRGGAVDYEPEDAGSSVTPSSSANALGNLFATTTGHGLMVSTVREFATTTCIVDRDVVLSDTAHDIAFLRVLQLRVPLNDASFPLVGPAISRSRLADGTEVLTAQPDDDSIVTVVAVNRDGLLVEVQARSSTGPDTTGWPTTMATMPVTQSTPSPVTLDEAVVVAKEMLSSIAGQA